MSAPADFFIGWSARTPPSLARFSLTVAALAVAAMVALALALGRAVDASAGDIIGEIAIAGILETAPYPLLRAPPDASHPSGHAVMLAGDGKYGIGAAANTFAGRAIEARGALVRRGDLDMLVVSPEEGLSPSPAPIPPPAAATRLGRWRVSGEICDGKCTAGVMRPGNGLAHKACASLCLAGGVPAVFVANAPVEGGQFLLLADAAGGPPPAAMADLIAIPVTLEGDVERRDDLLVFHVDWSRARAR